MSRRHKPPATPWPFVTVRKASVMLEVDEGFINRMVQAGRVRCVEVTDKMGRLAFLLNEEDVTRLRDQTRRQ